ncbi:hypothetical protein [Candidatus Bandiella numerosa]|nr:hypothetical protein [Candidatus Bandiella numerosa]
MFDNLDILPANSSSNRRKFTTFIGGTVKLMEIWPQHNPDP